MPEGTHEIRAAVTTRYGKLAQAAAGGEHVTDSPSGAVAWCPGASAYGQDTATLPDGAVRASLGCGNPVAVADLRPGDTVLDLGSGGGIDVLLSARRVRPGGKAYGLDATPAMIELARTNAAQAGARNVEFLHGCIEDIPLPDGHVDVVISNCVINLSTDKPAVLAEAFRVLRPGGRLGISDITVDDGLDPSERAAAERRMGCTVGTLTTAQYRDRLLSAGFTQITITPASDADRGLQSAIIQAAKPAAPAGLTIRPMRDTDATQVLAIYQAGLDTGNASFETTAPSWDTFTTSRLPQHRHVAADITAGRVLGWIAASAVSGRCVYSGVVEHSLYVHSGHQHRGIGAALLQALIGSTEAAGIWTIQAGIFPENTTSLTLHQHAGFRTVGTRQRISRHHGHWRDVTLIERRSTTAGTQASNISRPPQDKLAT